MGVADTSDPRLVFVTFARRYASASCSEIARHGRPWTCTTRRVLGVFWTVICTFWTCLTNTAPSWNMSTVAFSKLGIAIRKYTCVNPVIVVLTFAPPTACRTYALSFPNTIRDTLSQSTPWMRKFTWILDGAASARIARQAISAASLILCIWGACGM
jgi:hypothetical protein